MPTCLNLGFFLCAVVPFVIARESAPGVCHGRECDANADGSVDLVQSQIQVSPQRKRVEKKVRAQSAKAVKAQKQQKRRWLLDSTGTEEGEPEEGVEEWEAWQSEETEEVGLPEETSEEGAGGGFFSEAFGGPPEETEEEEAEEGVGGGFFSEEEEEGETPVLNAKTGTVDDESAETFAEEEEEENAIPEEGIFDTLEAVGEAIGAKAQDRHHRGARVPASVIPVEETQPRERAGGKWMWKGTTLAPAAPATCTCDTPGTGTAGQNKLSCDDGFKAACAATMECYATGSFPKGVWSLGCRDGATGETAKDAPTTDAPGTPEPPCEEPEVRPGGKWIWQDPSVLTSTSSPAPEMCSCTTPGAGTAGYNALTCTDGYQAACASTMECFATAPFPKGEWSLGCRDASTGVPAEDVPTPAPTAAVVANCTCDSPGAGTAGFNQLSCTDGFSASCASTMECYATEKFPKGSWSLGCRKADTGELAVDATTGAPPTTGAPASCRCLTPLSGTAGFNKLTCTDGYSASCASTMECYATGLFPKGSWSSGCRDASTGGLAPDSPSAEHVEHPTNPPLQQGIGGMWVWVPTAAEAAAAAADASMWMKQGMQMKQVPPPNR